VTGSISWSSAGTFRPTSRRRPPKERLIPARMLNEVVYCPRLFCLEHVAGEWEETADTLAGKRVHHRVDAKASPMPFVPARP
jgi:hypothetical protein